mgnify:CR=1 FL=1
MFPIGFFAGVVLIFRGATAGLGIASLAKWWQHRSQDFPEKKVTTHIVLQSTRIVMWVVFMVFMQPWIAWLMFATIWRSADVFQLPCTTPRAQSGKLRGCRKRRA